MITLKEGYSTYDIVKFVIIKVPKINGVDEDWDETLNAYMRVATMSVNAVTDEMIDSYINHNEILAEMNPKVQSKGGNKTYIDGYVDLHGDKFELILRDYYNILSVDEIRYLMKKFERYTKQRIPRIA